jgi:hypothetical protein
MSSTLDIYSSKADTATTPTTPTTSTTPKQPTKSKSKKPVQAFLRQNYDAVETLGYHDACYVNFRGKFAGLGVFTSFSLPRPGAGFAPIETSAAMIPYAVMNRFGLLVSPHRAVCKFKSSFEVNGQFVCIDKSRRLTINHKVYACLPCHEQDNWSDTWKYRLEIASCECTMLDGQVVVRPVVNITDQPWSGTGQLPRTILLCKPNKPDKPDSQEGQKAIEQLCINFVPVTRNCDEFMSRTIPTSRRGT